MHKIFLFIILLASVQLPVMGCSCIGESTVASALKNADFVAVGRIVARTRMTSASILKGAKLPRPDDTLSIYSYRYTVEIEEVYKGNRKSRTIDIFTGAGDGDCGITFSLGSRYVIYANFQRAFFGRTSGYQIKVPPYLVTDICTRTIKANEIEIAELERAASQFRR